MADDPLDHARQVAMVTSIISEAFGTAGMRCTLVGGSAIEIHAPGIFKSGDIDLVIEALAGQSTRDRLDPVFAALGFDHVGRHWQRDDLFVEVPSLTLDDPAEMMRVGHFALHVISKEVLLADRVVGFRHWGHTAYGQQAIDMISAFGNDIRDAILHPRLEREGSLDAFEALEKLAGSSEQVTEQTLHNLLERLRTRARN